MMLGKLTLKRLMYISVIICIGVMFATITFQRMTIQTLESEFLRVDAEADKHFHIARNQARSILNNSKIYNRQGVKWKAEILKLRGILKDFKTKNDLIAAETAVIKLNKERLENELETLKANPTVENYLDSDVPADVVDWLLK